MGGWAGLFFIHHDLFSFPLEEGANGETGNSASNDDVFHKFRIVRVIRSRASSNIAFEVAKLRRIWPAAPGPNHSGRPGTTATFALPKRMSRISAELRPVPVISANAT